MSKAGWIYFFLAGRIRRTAFGLDRQRTLRSAMNKLAKSVKSQDCNSFEMVDVTTRHFSGIFCVNVTAHARHFQKTEASCGE
jgi:hypothetical protein